MELIISVLAGTDEGIVKRFNDFPISIGRLPDNDFQLNDSFVSRRHCIIYNDDIILIVSDLKSTNKTILNTKIIYEPHSITNGDKLIIGKNLLLITVK